MINYIGQKIVFKIFLCNKRFSVLKEELEYRGIRQDKYVALIPDSIVETPLQFIYATLSLVIYGNEFKIRNKGLFYVMMCIGEDQISDAVNLLEESYKESSRYYIVFLEEYSDLNLKECSPSDIVDLESFSNVKTIVKNLDKIVRRL